MQATSTARRDCPIFDFSFVRHGRQPRRIRLLRLFSDARCGEPEAFGRNSTDKATPALGIPSAFAFSISCHFSSLSKSPSSAVCDPLFFVRVFFSTCAVVGANIGFLTKSWARIPSQHASRIPRSCYPQEDEKGHA